MSSVELLRLVVSERLSAAADEIFEAVKKTLAGYEEELLLSKQEIQRQRKILQAVLSPQIKINRLTDHPQLTHSVWDEDQQQQMRCDQESDPDLELPQTETSHKDLPSTQKEEVMEEEVVVEEKQEENTISFIIMNPYVHNTLNHLQSSEGDRDPLAYTSAELEQMPLEDDVVISGSEPECDGDEWRGSVGLQTDDSDSDRRMQKVKVRRLPLSAKLDLSKKSKPRICCKVCGRAFHATVSLVNHMDVHTKDICGVCGERFEEEESFQLHLKTHVKAEVCSFCGKCFGSSSSLEIHLRIHTGEKPFHCSECGKSFNCRHNMMRHIRIHTGEKPYSCMVCGKCFNDYSTLKRHQMLHLHKKQVELENTSAFKIENGNSGDNESCNDGEKTKVPLKKPQSRVICEVCGKMFHSMVPLVNHAKSHNTGLCGVCGIHFSSAEDLKNHLKTHKKGKVCEVCGKCFDGKRNLEMHMRIHTGEKPFQCSDCGKSFNCRHNLMRHIRTHTGEKPYTCDVCGRSFSDHSCLKQHSSMHTGEKPHHCEVCGKGFHRKTALRLHLESHTVIK